MDTVSSEAVAIIAGASAVLGALVGALAGGLMEEWRERRRQKARARAGGRLLRSDLSTAGQYLGMAEASGMWEVHWSPTPPSWEEYRDVLASFLKPSEWRIVDEAVSGLRVTETAEMASQGRQEGRVIHLMPPMKGNLRLRIESAKAAYNALASLAEGEAFEGDFGRIAASAPFDPATQTPEQAEQELREQASKRSAQQTHDRARAATQR
jgi:hypothetical protein